MTEVATSSAVTITSTDAAAKEEVPKEVGLLASGKRNLLCGEITTAVNQLQEACRLLAAKYGDLDDRCGEAYLCYGSALLDLSRMESGVLGNALQGIEAEVASEESEDKDDKAEDAEKSKDKEDNVEDPEKCTDDGEEREKVSNEVIDAMLETDEELAARQKKEGDEPTEKKTEKKEEDKKEDKTEEKTDEKAVEKKEEAATEKTDKKEEATAEKKDKKEEATTDKKEETATEKKDKKEETATEKAEVKKADEKTDEKMETDEKKDEKEGEDEEEGEEETEEGDTAEEEGDEAVGEEGKEEKEEDVSNLQLAWEILELAKVIYSKHDSKEMKLKAAEAYLKLGEVGLETEQYEQSIGDLRECLKLQQAHLEPESRLIAETHYQVGLACSFSSKHDDALGEFRLAVKTIESKIAKLTTVIEAAEAKSKGKEAASLDDPAVQAQKEVKDLKEILPDILAKIEDTEDEKRNQERVKEMVKENVASDLGTTTTTFGEKNETTKMETTDITHMIRKKRKPESESETDDSKKAKTENGAGDAAPTTNGKTEVTTNGN